MRWFTPQLFSATSHQFANLGSYDSVISYGDVQNIPRYPWTPKFNDRLIYLIILQGYSFAKKCKILGVFLC